MKGDYVRRLFMNATSQGKDAVMVIRFENGIEAEVRFRRYQ